MSIVCNVIKRPVFLQQTRSLFHWINLQFNVVDDDRTKQFGPDRTCAEWILRNGGAVKWVNSGELVIDYNELPREGTVLRLQEIDASDSSIMHNGFAHFKGCEYVRKIIFHKCNYLEDSAFSELYYLKKTLMFLQVSSCPNITEKGLLHLNVLSNLKELVMYDLQDVKNMDQVVAALKSSLPQCNIKVNK
ncbi:hypothetical protein NQ314_016532 [Rhamnusium bicolor]|uniref:Mitochondrial ATP synthase regulatory component factor B n=1 Tax=Rhamnusium bicolor TaxID=1586634 RepID=A0AAV8WVZ8_9CUCU|nr:hypothetical protein NQ314_016532 [Rhamnusium bicolor]